MEVDPPRNKPAALNGTDPFDPIRIQNARFVSVSPRTSTTVQVAINGAANTAPRFFQLVNGQALTMDAGEGNVFKPFDLNLFAGAALTVDVVWW